MQARSPTLSDEPPAPLAGRRSAPAQDAPGVRAQPVALLISLSILALLDVALTLVGLAMGGHEVNPIARFLLAQGLLVFIGARIVLCALMAVVFHTFAPAAPRVARGCVLALVILYGAVDLFSLLQLVMLWP